MSGGTKGYSLREFAWVWVWLTLAVSVAVGTVITMLLWGDTPTNHRDAFDIGWKSSAAVLAILAAFVTVERLRLSQREHHRQLANDEATHINTLSSQASEQLGSDKAAVRIGGLTDLERLAEQHPLLRQTVVDRICAYLRAPYQPPPDLAALADDAEPVMAAKSSAQPAQAEPLASELSDDEIAARRLELDVRRTAQQILQRHLRQEPDPNAEAAPHAFWEKISLDLRDAVLIETDFANCHMEFADFRDATFCGNTQFTEAVFTGYAFFARATFTGIAGFNKATFTRDALFDNVTFTKGALFSSATFAKTASFEKGMFTRHVRFGKATFAEEAWFSDATFTKEAFFAKASFAKDALFGDATFSESAWFNKATFSEGAQFDRVTFSGNVRFDGVADRDIQFGGARARLDRKHIWPEGWRTETSPQDHKNEAQVVRFVPSEGSGSDDTPEVPV
ncbi:pentapeptide repeat-containing protein [Amycolatopsis roodepoortensis]|uniref:pentapeptide repeat-containing protein n=1 Tax=Amycolatopsis roodepoortensis TaxID=700274 RepID=UPI00214AB082|nr:pentapeptide repeat-containing protein [Amycolatopsis roodepoortensis]UUV33602.1 pentapeptide repeat-containing protein [Amycolatopsis roodepoortensis]